MSLVGALLALLSAMCHSSWNIFSKSAGDPGRFIRRALRYSTLCYFPLFLFFQPFVSYRADYLLAVAISGLITGLYFFSLAKAYQHGTVSTTYPIARGVPIFLLAFVALFFGDFPSLIGLAGMMMIVLGCFVLPLNNFSRETGGFYLKSYLSRSSCWAYAAASFTCAYTLIDKSAAMAMPSDPFGIALVAKINYVYLQNAIAWLIVELASGKGTRVPHGRLMKHELYAGMIFLVSYSLALMAMTTDSAAYVMSIRQFSIVITTLVSMAWVEKFFSKPRAIGSAIIFMGLVLVGPA